MHCAAVLRRALAATAASVTIAAGLVLAVATPAVAADLPDIRPANLCGALRFDWGPDEPVLGDSGPGTTTVLRNGVVVDEFQMGPRGDYQIGAVHTDVIELRWPELGRSDSFRYLDPGGCENPPRLRITPKDTCFRVALKLENNGSAPIEGLTLLVSVPPHERPLPAPDPGTSHQYVPLADGDRYGVRSTLPDGSHAIWLLGTFRQPAGCDREHITVQVTEICGGVRMRVDNGAGGDVVLDVRIEGHGRVRSQEVLARSAEIFEVPAPRGSVLLMGDVTGNLDFGSHTVAGTSCATPATDPTHSPTAGPSTDAPGGGGGGDGDGLPVTGFQTAALAAGGVLMAVAGLALLIIVRRRRLWFTAPEQNS
ncbi:LPXTG cell wall anchor domain-containing protein [Micromonospora deserti]|uniref:LPXTG cell wall anchor domain-containing protein n=1 Tax=Micromonospora deserti TaxID=2070366 RepID=A0A2W2CSE5_9ACTN|nr:LPXTG cell wall anchor domain-containing protein [Micromonospora deserti]PZG01513.1 hypothetical protein C1I99_06805 [Micromonospora deserti]